MGDEVKIEETRTYAVDESGAPDDETGDVEATDDPDEDGE